MKLVQFSQNGHAPRLGILRGEAVVDLQASYAATLAKNGVGRADALAAVILPSSTRAFLEAGPAATDAIKSITEWVTAPVNSVRLHAPIRHPRTTGSSRMRRARWPRCSTTSRHATTVSTGS